MTTGMASEDNDFKAKAARQGGKIAEACAATKHMPGRQYSLATGKYLSKSTRAGIVDNATGKWLVRLDNPHKKLNTPHININDKLTGVRDPHIPIPAGVVKAGEGATKVLNAVGKVALVAAVAVDTYRICNAIDEDCKKTKKKRPGKRTIKTGASVAGGWGGGFVGAVAGNFAGARIGGLIGSLFGGVGALPGAAIGAFVGSVVGGFQGSTGGSAMGEALVEEYCSDDEEDDDGDYDDAKVVARK
ncbi:uncharacterized protein C13G5.2-like isoform X1 [Periplaneta americana]|uniref:uncharacterized protein C13G5.2-like isoform X1 n=1 Tax=Periplaneta americana TaxID=6978 RepID=UPI0037E7F0F1